MTAHILRHPARPVRWWAIVQGADGAWMGRIAGDRRISLRTERGPLPLVIEAIRTCQRQYAGLPEITIAHAISPGPSRGFAA